MDLEQGGSADALAIFQEAFNAQQRAPPTINNDRKMLYVHPLPPPHPTDPFQSQRFRSALALAAISSLFKTAQAARDLTFRLPQKTSSSSARTSFNRASCNPVRTCASASSPFAITHRKTTPTSHAILVFRPILTRSNAISRASMPRVVVTDPRRLLLP